MSPWDKERAEGAGLLAASGPAASEQGNDDKENETGPHAHFHGVDSVLREARPPGARSLSWSQPDRAAAFSFAVSLARTITCEAW